MLQTISTIQNNNEKGPYTAIALYLLGVSLVGVMVFFGGEIIKNFDDLKSKSAVTIDSLNQPAKVYINDKDVGTTPYESKKINPGENRITLKTENQIYETRVTFLPNDNTTIYNVGIFRDLGISNVFSSGQEFWYEKESGNNKLKIISNPTGATVHIDGTEVGKTPYSSDTLSVGSYDLDITQEGFETQTARINIEKGHTLDVSIKLFPLPLPSNVNKFEGSDNLYAIFSDNDAVLSNTQVWVDAIVYWNSTRGVTLDEGTNNKEQVFDYFLDYKGNLFDRDGHLTTLDQVNKVGKGAYLGKASSEGNTLSSEAKTTYLSLSNKVIISGKTVTIKETGLGWLRVRSGPSVDSSEVQKVNVGEKFEMLDEQNGWIKIRINDTTTGWALKDYLLVE